MRALSRFNNLKPMTTPKSQMTWEQVLDNYREDLEFDIIFDMRGPEKTTKGKGYNLPIKE